MTWVSYLLGNTAKFQTRRVSSWRGYFFEHTIEIPHSAEKVFSVLEDLQQTPRWLARCTKIELVDPPPLRKGSQMRYFYTDAGRKGVMNGLVKERTENRKLHFEYEDEQMVISASFEMTPTEMGSTLHHAVEITPKAFVTKLMAPVIRSQLPKDTLRALESLRDFLDLS